MLKAVAIPALRIPDDLPYKRERADAEIQRDDGGPLNQKVPGLKP